MAKLSGKVAKIEYGGGKVLSIQDWSVDVDNDMLDVTTMTTGTLQWKTFITGLSEWTADASGFFDATDTGLGDIITNTLTPTTAQFIGYLDKSGGENFRGSCLVSSLGASADVSDSVDIDFAFQGTGALTYSTAT